VPLREIDRSIDRSRTNERTARRPPSVRLGTSVVQELVPHPLRRFDALDEFRSEPPDVVPVVSVAVERRGRLPSQAFVARSSLLVFFVDGIDHHAPAAARTGVSNPQPLRDAVPVEDVVLAAIVDPRNKIVSWREFLETDRTAVFAAAVVVVVFLAADALADALVVPRSQGPLDALVDVRELVLLVPLGMRQADAEDFFHQDPEGPFGHDDQRRINGDKEQDTAETEMDRLPEERR